MGRPTALVSDPLARRAIDRPRCRGLVAGRARYMVTNQDFGAFVRNTSYVTDSEKYGWSFVFILMLSEEQRRTIPQARPPRALAHARAQAPTVDTEGRRMAV